MKRRVKASDALKAMRRVLRLIDRVLALQNEYALTTDGRGLITWAELRRHVRAAIALRVDDGRPGKKAPRKKAKKGAPK